MTTSKSISLTAGGLVTRSPVEVGLPYTSYKHALRYDFLYSCAYCTMTEYEARGERFTIDHYEPQGTPDFEVDAYDNLMYCCDECNRRKGNRRPPLEHRHTGFRFYRPDQDHWDDHFERSGSELKHRSNTGFYTKEALDLNRQSLQRLWDYRARLSACNEAIAEGIVGLARVHIDRLPRESRMQALSAIKRARAVAGRMAEDIDQLLRDNARSELLDEDMGAADRAKGRLANLKAVEAMLPGQWRQPRNQGSQKR